MAGNGRVRNYLLAPHLQRSNMLQDAKHSDCATQMQRIAEGALAFGLEYRKHVRDTGDADLQDLRENVYSLHKASRAILSDITESLSELDEGERLAIELYMYEELNVYLHAFRATARVLSK